MSRLSLKNLDIKDKKVLIRVDFNVPLDKNGNITDDSKIEASVPTIRYVLEKGGYPILMSHLGRPKGKRVPELSLAPCAKRLMTMLGKPVIMVPDCVGD
ncbi:MAG TPA: phosphoglycerate kinase, partial [Waddliaceae bacterium]